MEESTVVHLVKKIALNPYFVQDYSRYHIINIPHNIFCILLAFTHSLIFNLKLQSYYMSCNMLDSGGFEMTKIDLVHIILELIS